MLPRFGACLKQGRRFDRELRVKPVRGLDGVYEVTWEGYDGRATSNTAERSSQGRSTSSGGASVLTTSSVRHKESAAPLTRDRYRRPLRQPTFDFKSVICGSIFPADRAGALGGTFFDLSGGFVRAAETRPAPRSSGPASNGSLRVVHVNVLLKGTDAHEHAGRRLQGCLSELIGNQLLEQQQSREYLVTSSTRLEEGARTCRYQHRRINGSPS
jgi:hypothetical protein